MTDEELSISDTTLIAWLRDLSEVLGKEVFTCAADRIEALQKALKDQSSVSDRLAEQLAAARRDAEEAEAYAAELADRIEELEAKLAKVKEAFRINMMHALPAYTHAQFDKDYEEMMGGKDE